MATKMLRDWMSLMADPIREPWEDSDSDGDSGDNEREFSTAPDGGGVVIDPTVDFWAKTDLVDESKTNREVYWAPEK